MKGPKLPKVPPRYVDPGLRVEVTRDYSPWKEKQRLMESKVPRLVLKIEPPIIDGTRIRFSISLGVAGSVSIPNVDVVMRSMDPGFVLPRRLQSTLQELEDFGTILVNPGRPIHFYELAIWDTKLKRFQYNSRSNTDLHTSEGKEHRGAKEFRIIIDVRGLNTVGKDYVFLLRVHTNSVPELTMLNSDGNDDVTNQRRPSIAEWLRGAWEHKGRVS